jgi:hypothetical protein
MKGRGCLLEHVTRLRPDIAPDWPQGANGSGYYITIDGDPMMTCHFDQQNAAGDHVAWGILATATRIVNAIPAVCAARETRPDSGPSGPISASPT